MSLNTIADWRASTQLTDETHFPDSLVTQGLDSAYNFIKNNEVIFTGLQSFQHALILQGEIELATSEVFAIKDLTEGVKSPTVKLSSITKHRLFVKGDSSWSLLAQKWRQRALRTLRPFLPLNRPYAKKLVDRQPIFISGEDWHNLQLKKQTPEPRPSGR